MAAHLSKGISDSPIMNTYKAKLCEPESFIGVPFRNMDEAEMTQTSCITETHPSMLDGSQQLDPWSSLYNSCKELSQSLPL